MKVENEAYLNTMRAQRKCEHCGKAVAGCEPHHVLPKGMGGAGQMDIPPNIIGLCYLCHRKFHDGNTKRFTFLGIIGRRLGITAEEVLQECYRVRALPKGSIHGYETQQGTIEEGGGIRF